MEKKTYLVAIGVVVLLLALSAFGFMFRNGFDNPFSSVEKASNIGGNTCVEDVKEQVYEYEGVAGSMVKETQIISTAADCCITIEGEIETTSADQTVETETYEVTKCE